MQSIPYRRSRTAVIVLLVNGAVVQMDPPSRSERKRFYYSSSEIKWKTTFGVKAYQKRLEDVARNIRELNGQIQQANWQTDL